MHYTHGGVERICTATSVTKAIRKGIAVQSGCRPHPLMPSQSQGFLPDAGSILTRTAAGAMKLPFRVQQGLASPDLSLCNTTVP